MILHLHLKSLAVIGLVSLLCSSGCSNLNHTGNGALVGSGIGAATGAIIGHQSGHRDAGALIGAAAGAVGGAVVGQEQQIREDHQTAMAAARQAEWQRHADAQAVTNHDIVRMTKGGLSDSVIINAIHTRGGRFDMSPDALIAMKTDGVDDNVIQAMQQGSGAKVTTTVPAGSPSVVTSPAPPAVVYVAPRPSASIVIGPRPIVIGPRHRHRHHHHRRWRRHW